MRTLTNRQSVIRTPVTIFVFGVTLQLYREQAKEITKSQHQETVFKVVRSQQDGSKHSTSNLDEQSQKRMLGASYRNETKARTFKVRVCLNGPTWGLHLERLQPRHINEDET